MLLTKDIYRTMDKFAKIICRVCGPQYLSCEQYTEEIRKPEIEWLCPRCGDNLCLFDDEYATLQLKQQTTTTKVKDSMNIIKQGKSTKGIITMYGHCNECHCVFSAHFADCRWKPNSYSRGNYTADCVCPNCQEWVEMTHIEPPEAKTVCDIQPTTDIKPTTYPEPSTTEQPVS